MAPTGKQRYQLRRKYHLEYKRLNREKCRKYYRDYNKKYRLKTIELLGNRCIKCGFSDWRALQVDHINGGGSKDNRKNGKITGKIVYEEVLMNKSKYQLLCANCNWIKRYVNNETSLAK